MLTTIMKKILLSLLILTLLIASCDKKRNLLEREKLYGKWYDINNPEAILEFNPDSLIFRTNLPSLNTWRIKNNQIILSNSTTFYHDPLDPIMFPKTQFTYEISSNLDTLFWTASRSDYNETFKLIKLKDQFEHYQKLIKLKIDLPYSQNKLQLLSFDDYTIDLKIGIFDGKITCVCGYDYRLGGIPDIKVGLLNFLSRINENEIEKVNINLIIDKNVSQESIESVKNNIKEIGIKNIFRVYINDSINYKNNLNWYGISEN